MGQVAKMIFGGGNDDAKRAAENQRQLQKVANDRQLAQLNESDRSTGASRRAPRGRRLLLSDSSKGGLATTLGG